MTAGLRQMNDAPAGSEPVIFWGNVKGSGQVECPNRGHSLSLLRPILTHTHIYRGPRATDGPVGDGAQ
jgi:hypothetical protein